MSSLSESCVGALTAITAIAATVVLTIGCGPSPALSRAAVRMVRVEDGRAVPCCCSSEEDDEVDMAAPPSKHVQYVLMTEWRTPESVKRIESEIIARGDEAPAYIDFPRLRLHEAIVEANVRPVGRNPAPPSER
jgi:hypothetical protein